MIKTMYKKVPNRIKQFPNRIKLLPNHIKSMFFRSYAW